MSGLLYRLKGIIYRRFIFLLYKTRNFRFKRIANKIDTNKPIKCVYLALFDTEWKCDSLYKEMLQDKRFEPVILICPVVNYGRENMLRRMDECASFFDAKGYPYIKAYDKDRDEYIDIKKSLNPDVLIYFNPYQGLIDPRYYIDRFPNILCCYLPYFFASSNSTMFFDLPFHHLLWKFYIENDFLRKEYELKSKWEYSNLVPVGYCVFDDFVIKNNNNKDYKTIIWAPHHGLDDGVSYIRNSFLKYKDLFFDIAKRYNGKIHFVFRPHPLLRNNLYKHPEWGIEKTDTYYKKWEETDFCQLRDSGDYIEIFNDSDAMIHDCGSFMTEYLLFNKPGMYTVKDSFSLNDYWKCAVDGEHCYYEGDSIEEIEQFIENVVIKGIDYKKKDREMFLSTYISQYQNVGKHIIEDIYSSINELKES